MRYDRRGSSLVILHNFSDKPQEVRIRPGGGEDGDRLVNLLVHDESKAKRNGMHTISLEAHGYRWYRVGALNYSLHQRKM